jgi:RimJ/RimL family protein N-acetyltransferase
MKNRLPALGINSLDEYSIESITANDLQKFINIIKDPEIKVHNRIPDTDAELEIFFSRMGMHLWGSYVFAYRNNELVGIIGTSRGDPSSLSVEITSVLIKPDLAKFPLAIFLRRVFWNFPINRIYCYCPLTQNQSIFTELYMSVGFVNEGKLPRYWLEKNQRFDICILGLLREDFLNWCKLFEPRLLI